MWWSFIPWPHPIISFKVTARLTTAGLFSLLDKYAWLPRSMPTSWGRKRVRSTCSNICVCACVCLSSFDVVRARCEFPRTLRKGDSPEPCTIPLSNQKPSWRFLSRFSAFCPPSLEHIDISCVMPALISFLPFVLDILSRTRWEGERRACRIARGARGPWKIILFPDHFSSCKCFPNITKCNSSP